MSPEYDQAKLNPRGLPWWWIALPWLAFVLAAFLYWLRRQRRVNLIQPVKIDLSFIRPPQSPITVPASTPPQAVSAPATVAEPAPLPVEDNLPAQPDDLTVIHGIGPKVAAVLRTSGVETFARLGQADPTQLRELLLQANLRLADPSSWPEQARLAAAGKWEELKAFVDSQRARRGS